MGKEAEKTSKKSVVTEKELTDNLEQLRNERVERCAKRVQEILIEENCSMQTDQYVVINGKPLQIVIASL